MTPAEQERKLKVLEGLKKHVAVMDAITKLAHHIYDSDPDDLTRRYTNELIKVANKAYENLES